jgi:hypothetical protein
MKSLIKFEERAFGDSLTTELTKTRKPDVKTKNNSSEREKGIWFGRYIYLYHLH